MSVSGLVTCGYIDDPFSVTKTLICKEEIVGLIEDADPDLIGTVIECGLALPLWTGWTTSPGPYTEADILALNQVAAPLVQTGLFQVNLSPQIAYLVAVYPDENNGASPTDFFVGNFLPGGASEIQTGLSMTVPSGTELFTVARSDLIITSSGINWQRIS